MIFSYRPPRHHLGVLQDNFRFHHNTPIPTQSTLKEPQLKILKFLFDRGEPVFATEVFQLLATPKSEAEYHTDILREQGLINHITMPIHMTRLGEDPFPGFEINAKGRKHIMESA